MFGFVKRIFSSDIKQTEDKKEVSSFIEQIDDFLNDLELDYLFLIDEPKYEGYKRILETLKEEYYRKAENRYSTICNFGNLSGEYIAYKSTLHFKEKYANIRKDVIINSCKEVLEKSKNGSTLEELLNELEDIKRVQRLTDKIKSDEYLLEIIKQTSYLLHKNFYSYNKEKEIRLRDEELLLFKNQIIRDASSLIRKNNYNSLEKEKTKEIEELFIFKNPEDIEVLRALYDKICGFEIEDQIEVKDQIELTLYPKSIEINEQDFEESLQQITKKVNDLILIDETKYNEYVKALSLIKSGYLIGESKVKLLSDLKDLENKYNEDVVKKVYQTQYDSVMKCILEVSNQKMSYTDFLSFLKEIESYDSILSIPKVSIALKKLEYRFLPLILEDPLNYDRIFEFKENIIEDLLNNYYKSEVDKFCIDDMNKYELINLYLTKCDMSYNFKDSKKKTEFQMKTFKNFYLSIVPKDFTLHLEFEFEDFLNKNKRIINTLRKRPILNEERTMGIIAKLLYINFSSKTNTETKRSIIHYIDSIIIDSNILFIGIITARKYYKSNDIPDRKNRERVKVIANKFLENLYKDEKEMKNISKLGLDKYLEDDSTFYKLNYLYTKEASESDVFLKKATLLNMINEPNINIEDANNSFKTFFKYYNLSLEASKLYLDHLSNLPEKEKKTGIIKKKQL